MTRPSALRRIAGNCLKNLIFPCTVGIHPFLLFVLHFLHLISIQMEGPGLFSGRVHNTF